MTLPRLSLVAEFDDLVRCRTILSSSVEQEFSKFVANQEVCRQQWQEAVTAFQEYNKRARELEQDNEALKTKLKHARSQIEHEMTKRQRIEQERDAYERQIMIVRELLNEKNRTVLDDKDRERLAFLSADFTNSQFAMSPKHNLTTIDESGSLLSPSDISYDRTEEDLDGTRAHTGRSSKRRSTQAGDEENEVILSGKRSRRDVRKKHRRSNSADIATVAAAAATEQSEMETGERQRRFSTPGPATPLHSVDSNANLRDADADDDRALLSSARKRNGSPSMESASMKRFGSGNSLSKLHIFTTKNFFKQDLCAVCGKKPRFGSKVAKCKDEVCSVGKGSDCRLVAHQECKDLLPLPCIPTPVTPGKNAVAGLIADYVSSEPPMIPALVIRCVEEVNARGLKEEGLYRISGSDKDVKELKEKFLKGKTLPNLGLVNDIHVVCGCLKDFLRGLKEPLITYRLWTAFCNAVEKSDELESTSDLYQAIGELPQPNRDTLAYIILHLQKISDIPACKMPVDNLATVFGPTVIGYSSAEPTMNQIMTQTKTQQLIIKRLMAIPSEYWSTYTKADSEFDGRARDFSTPMNYRHLPKYNFERSGPVSVPPSMLGPVDAPLSATYKRTRGNIASKKPQQFFDSPDLR